MALRAGFPGPFAREAAAALAWMAAFVALGAGARGLAGAAHVPAYAPPPMAEAHDEPADEPRTWLVDGFNLMHAVVLRGRDRQAWWRAQARGRVLELVRRLDAPDAEVVVVFDGPRPPDEPESAADGPRVVFAESADDWLIRAVREAPDPSRIAVVTADRQLAERARRRGAQVVRPRAFAERCGAA